MEDLIEKDPTSESEQVEETQVETTEQDPLKEELEKVQRKEGKTEAEKAAFSLKKNAERAKELGIDPAEVLGLSRSVVEDDIDEDEKPITIGMWKKMQQETATKTALQIAEDIESDTERELTKYHLENTIKSTGNPTEDVNLARAIVNAAKNKQIIEESTRKTEAKTFSSASSAPLKHEEEVELTKEEMMYTQAPFFLSKDEILAARKKK